MTAINDFLLSLAFAIATAAELTMRVDPASSDKASIWICDAIEELSTAARTVLRIYGGADQGAFADARRVAVSIQHDTRGLDAVAVMAQAWAAYEATKDDQGRPRGLWAVAGKTFDASGAIIDDSGGSWLVNVYPAGAPGLVGRPEERWMATVNYSCDFTRVAA